jgi:hypothetical protein
MQRHGGCRPQQVAQARSKWTWHETRKSKPNVQNPLPASTPNIFAIKTKACVSVYSCVQQRKPNNDGRDSNIVDRWTLFVMAAFAWPALFLPGCLAAWQPGCLAVAACLLLLLSCP